MSCSRDESGTGSPGSAYRLAVGPEGGFTEEEVSCARQAGWQPVDLGPRTLRVETAALALAALIAERWPAVEWGARI